MVYHAKQVSRRIAVILKTGGIGVMPTDTIYGLVGSALNKKTVERIYKLRRRNPKKPMIILIGSLHDLKRFGVKPDTKTTRFLKAIWLRQKQHTNILENVGVLFRDKKPTSVILPLSQMSDVRCQMLKYLHRGTKALAFRLPKPTWLRRLLAKTGPLVAPSANPEGLPPARTIRKARQYFGDEPDFYVDGGKIAGKPSRLIRIGNGEVKILRK